MKKSYLLSGTLALAVFLGACQSEESAETTNTADNANPETEVAESYAVTDDLGNEVKLEEIPETVVSLIPSNTEILYALEEGDKLIGATDFDNYPEEALEVERVSDSVKFNAERIIQLDPDIVLAYSTGGPTGLEVLEEADIPVFVIESAASFEDVYGDIEQIAQVMGVEEKGEELIASIQGEIKDVQDKLAEVEQRKKAYIEISPLPEIYTTGDKTFQQEIMNHAQVENVFADLEGWPQLSEEEVVNRNPELIFTTVSYVENAVDEIKARDSWSEIAAVQNEQVFLLDSDITSRPGPRIGEAVKLVAETAYPDLLK